MPADTSARRAAVVRRRADRVALVPRSIEPVREVVAAPAIGAPIGSALPNAGRARGGTLEHVVRLRDLTRLRLTLTALGVGAAGVQLGVGLGLLARAPVRPFVPLANALGAAVFGDGATHAAAAQGRLDAVVAGASGLLVGAIVFSLLQPMVMPALSRVGALRRVALAHLAGPNPWWVLLTVAQTVVLVLALLARSGHAPA